MFNRSCSWLFLDFNKQRKADNVENKCLKLPRKQESNVACWMEHGGGETGTKKQILGQQNMRWTKTLWPASHRTADWIVVLQRVGFVFIFKDQSSINHQFELRRFLEGRKRSVYGRICCKFQEMQFCLACRVIFVEGKKALWDNMRHADEPLLSPNGEIYRVHTAKQRQWRWRRVCADRSLKIKCELRTQRTRLLVSNL